MQKQGDMTADGAPARGKRQGPAPRPQTDERSSPAEFIKEVRGELRKVVWPTRSELMNYSIVVFITIVVLTSLIAGLDWLAGESVFKLYDT